MSVASEKTPIAAAVTLQHDPETLALGGPLKALAGFFVSGFCWRFWEPSFLPGDIIFKRTTG